MNLETKASSVSLSILANGSSVNHGQEIGQAIKAASDIFLSVAFLKRSGLDQIVDDIQDALDRGSNLTAVIGLDFCLTDPAALDVLFSLQERNPKCRLHVFRAHKSFTYHPKFYRFQTDDDVLLVVGSANLTAGGLSKNIEASVLCRTPNTSELARSAAAFEKTILEHPRCFSPSYHDLLHYRSQHSIYRAARTTAERLAKRKVAELVKLDSIALQDHLQRYRSSTKERLDLKARQKNYVEARRILGKILGGPSTLDEAVFRRAYERLVGKGGAERLWHSGSLHRQRNQVIPRHASFQKMVREIRENLGLPTRDMYALGRGWMKRIPHLGPNVFTEVCNTFRPDLYAVLNKNPTTSLHALGRGAFKSSTLFSPEDYEDFCKVLADLRDECGFANFGETDHFLNYVYWWLKHNKASASSDGEADD